MVVSKDTLPCDRNMPTAQIIKECLGIANTTEREKRTVANLAQILEVGMAAITTKAQQTSFGIKDAVFVSIAGLDVGALSFACDHQDVGTAAGGDGFAQNPRR